MGLETLVISRGMAMLWGRGTCQGSKLGFEHLFVGLLSCDLYCLTINWSLLKMFQCLRGWWVYVLWALK